MLRGSTRLAIGSLAWILLPSGAGADTVSTAPAIARAGGGQSALAVGFDGAGQLHARACAKGPCTLDGAESIAVPEGARRRAAKARLTIVPVGLGRKAVVVEIPEEGGAGAWTAIVAAPLGGAKPVVPWSGATGFQDGLEGERTGPSVIIREEGIYVGTRREGSDLCGRPALLGPKALDPATLTLKPAKLQRLGEAERTSAPELLAAPVPDADAPPPPMFRASWATSSASKTSAAALTDGNVETAWAEDRGGVGRGEFAILRGPREVPIGAFEFALASRAGPIRSPDDIWIATDGELFRVKVPSAAGADGPARYRIALPKETRTSCIAVVIEGSGGAEQGAAVGLAELWARPALTQTVPELVRALPGGGPGAEAAGAVLRGMGGEGFQAVREAFSGLDEGGKRVALDVLDDAPCEVALPVYIGALVGTVDALRRHVERAMVRCGSEIGPAIRTALRGAKRRQRVLLAEELVHVAPRAAVEELVPRLKVKDAEERRAYRAALYRAAETQEGRGALLAALEAPDPTGRITLELLRALDGALPSIGAPAERALERLSSPNASFETRFLLLAPAATLAGKEGPARAFLRAKLASDPSAHVRAEAARLLPLPSLFAGELSRLLDDEAARVREAAALALGRGRIDGAAPALVERLGDDPWPLVRAASARALASLGKGPELDRALRDALSDESHLVRRSALLGLGARGALGEARRVRERLEDDEERPDVRAAAATALGLMCDRAAAPLLAALAGRLARPRSDADGIVGTEAVLALGMLSPKDAASRLAPLRAKGVPPAVRRLADQVAKGPGRCGA